MKYLLLLVAGIWRKPIHTVLTTLAIAVAFVLFGILHGVIVAYVVSAIMALGAVFGALNTMYTAVAARSVEIATLRAIGFGATPIVISVLIEALFLALVGALAGAAVAWLLFNGNAFSIGGAFRQVAVRLDVGSALFVIGVAWACGIGLLGGLLPAIRAARQPVSLGLRVAA